MVYLLTFNCYGVWLPGDERGSIDRTRGDHRGGYIPPNHGLNQYCREVMKQPPYRLDLPRAQVVLDAIREVCLCRDWDLIAAHVRTTHAHVIVDRLRNVDRAIVDLKSYSSRALKSFGCKAEKRWARGGSTRPLSTTATLSAAIDYVLHRQGKPVALSPAPVQIGQETGQQTDRRQKRAHLVDEVNTIPVR